MADAPAIQLQQQMIENLIQQLQQCSQRFTLCETHLSWVLVADEFAYKIKKALRFDFVDYSGLEQRHYFYEKELGLNRVLAPEIYLGVVPVTGSYTEPVLDGQGDAIDFAVKMRAFEQDALWSRRLDKKAVQPGEIDRLAALLAEFHEHAAIAPPDSQWGSPAVVRATALTNLADLAQFARNAEEKAAVQQLAAWNAEELIALHPLFVARKAKGFVRECHGDLHRGNILTANGMVQVFDRIEFSESLRWIDVISDIAFVWMELGYAGYKHYAARFLNAYLEHTGDYEGLQLLPYYAIQRALVRSKVAFITAAHPLRKGSDAQAAIAQASAYLFHAHSCLDRKKHCLMITHGFSGSGKTSFARKIVEFVGAVQLRSDVERKRKFRMPEMEGEAGGLNEGLYGPEKSAQVYGHLRRLARISISSGFPVIVDAAFLRKEQRKSFRELAAELQVPFYIFDMHAPPAVLKERIAVRRGQGRDASDATQEILNYQLEHHDALSAEETACAIRVDTDHECDPAGMPSLRSAMRTWVQ